jgi:hypothetical protein
VSRVLPADLERFIEQQTQLAPGINGRMLERAVRQLLECKRAATLTVRKVRGTDGKFFLSIRLEEWAQ